MSEPEKSMEEFSLSIGEMADLQSSHSGRIRMAMKHNTKKAADQVAICLVSDP